MLRSTVALVGGLAAGVLYERWSDWRNGSSTLGAAFLSDFYGVPEWLLEYASTRLFAVAASVAFVIFAARDPWGVKWRGSLMAAGALAMLSAFSAAVREIADFDHLTWKWWFYLDLALRVLALVSLAFFAFPSWLALTGAARGRVPWRGRVATTMIGGIAGLALAVGLAAWAQVNGVFGAIARGVVPEPGLAITYSLLAGATAWFVAMGAGIGFGRIAPATARLALGLGAAGTAYLLNLATAILVPPGWNDANFGVAYIVLELVIDAAAATIAIVLIPSLAPPSRPQANTNALNSASVTAPTTSGR